jgi:hypothetical protein
MKAVGNWNVQEAQQDYEDCIRLSLREALNFKEEDGKQPFSFKTKTNIISSICTLAKKIHHENIREYFSNPKNISQKNKQQLKETFYSLWNRYRGRKTHSLLA